MEKVCGVTVLSPSFTLSSSTHTHTHAIPIKMVSLGVGNYKNVTLWSHSLFTRDWMSALGIKQKKEKNALSCNI